MEIDSRKERRPLEAAFGEATCLGGQVQSSKVGGHEQIAARSTALQIAITSQVLRHDENPVATVSARDLHTMVDQGPP